MEEAGSTDSDSKRPETDELRAVKAELEGLRVQAERELLHSEAALIEQEHRWIRIAVNIWNAIHVWRGPDPRRRPSVARRGRDHD